MSNIKEWISDNLRYLLLVLLVVVVLVGGFFGVRAINKIGHKDKGDKQTEARTTESEENSDVIVSQDPDALVENDTKILTMMTSYYTAKTNKDIETLVKLDPTINQAEEVENLENTYVESYTNIKTYSKNGPEAGTCVVYVCYDGKVRDIETMVPSLVQFFLKTDSEGNYYIAEAKADSADSAFLEETKKSPEVQALINQVNTACEQAKESDSVLKAFMDKYGSSQSNSKKEEASDDDKDEETKVVKKTWMIAIDSCNVRAGASTDTEVVGALAYGEEVESTGKVGDWYQVIYEGNEAYVIQDYLLTEDEFDKLGEEENAEENPEDAYYYDEYSDEYYYYEEEQY